MLSPCFFDGSGHLRCLASDASENSTSDALDIGKSGFPEIRIFGDAEVRKSENPDFRIPGSLDFRKSEIGGRKSALERLGGLRARGKAQGEAVAMYKGTTRWPCPCCVHNRNFLLRPYHGKVLGFGGCFDSLKKIDFSNFLAGFGVWEGVQSIDAS